MLRRGSRGSAVRTLQEFLAAAGYYEGAIDGIFGPITDRAVREFQGDNVDVDGNPLAVDGVVGPLTQGAIDTIQASDDGEVTPPADDTGTPPATGDTSGGDIFQPPIVFDNTGGIDVTVPAGGTLVRVTDPEGSDAAVLNFLVYDTFGIQTAYEIGDDAALQETFGDFQFGNILTVNQMAFDDAGIVEAGLVDEILGNDESIGSQVQRELRLLGFEDIPPWIRGDQTALTTLMTATREGWSPGRTAQALAQTDGFENRFPGFAALQERLGTGVLAALDRYTTLENQFRSLVTRYRGPTATTDQQYIGRLIEIGWEPEDAEPIFQAERTVRDNPAALDNLNEVLAFNGLPPAGPQEFIEIMTGQAPPDVFEVLNDAFRRQALRDQGIDIDEAFATALGTGSSSGVVTPGEFAPVAQNIASTVARNFAALSNNLFGLERDDIIAAAFNETSPTGRSSSEISEVLLRIQRTAQAQATGLGSGTAFIDPNDRLRIQGLSPLG